MEIIGQTKLSQILKEYPYIKKELPSINSKFKTLNTPLGKAMINNVTIADMAKKSNMNIDFLICELSKLINKHK